MRITSLDSGRNSHFVVYMLTLNRKMAVQIELTAGDNTKREAEFLPTGVNSVTLFPARSKTKVARVYTLFCDIDQWVSAESGHPSLRLRYGAVRLLPLPAMDQLH